MRGRCSIALIFGKIEALMSSGYVTAVMTYIFISLHYLIQISRGKSIFNFIAHDYSGGVNSVRT